MTWRRMTLVVAAVAMTLAAAGCGGSGSDNESGLAQRETTGVRTSDAAESAGGGGVAADAARGAPSAAPSQAATGGTGATTDRALGALDRKIIFTTGLDLQVPDVQATFSEVARMARTAGGFVDSSNLSVRRDSDGEERPYGTIAIRVPAEAYQDTLVALRTLPGGKVLREESKSSEVTEQYVDLQSRLRTLERTEEQYLKLLEQAKTIQEILTVNDRLDGVRAQIEQVQGRLNVLDDLTELATITVSLTPVVPAKAVEEEGRRGPAEAFADAWEGSLEVVRNVANAGAYVAVAAIWLALPLALLAAGLAAVRRTRSRPAA